jgi:hypothetical protein
MLTLNGEFEDSVFEALKEEVSVYKNQHHYLGVASKGRTNEMQLS